MQRTINLLKEKQKTVIVIAHRLSTAMAEDKIFVLEQGKLIEQGKHEDLINSEGKYFHLWTQQYPGLGSKSMEEKIMKTKLEV